MPRSPAGSGGGGSSSGPTDGAATSQGERAVQRVTRAELRAWLTHGGFSADVAGRAATEAVSVREALAVALSLSTGPVALVTAVSEPPSLAAGPEAEPEPAAEEGATGPQPAEEAARCPPATSWNAFQQRLGGTGLTRTEVARLYAEEREVLRLRLEGAPQPLAGQGGSVTAGPVPFPGYLVLRAPFSQAHLLGLHRCSWQQLLDRLGVTRAEHQERRSEFYTPRFRGWAEAERLWVGQGLALPVPLR
jgi:hypothetical protein